MARLGARLDYIVAHPLNQKALGDAYYVAIRDVCKEIDTIGRELLTMALLYSASRQFRGAA
jgi:hypothetical protein